MKRILSVICFLSLLLGLVGCSHSTPALSDILDDVKADCSLTGVSDITDVAELCRYYAVNQQDILDFAACAGEGAADYTEIVIISAVDRPAADRVAAILYNHLDARLSDSIDYHPDVTPMLELCEVQEQGNTVILVIAENAQALSESIIDRL